jgi:hypothetical protein
MVVGWGQPVHQKWLEHNPACLHHSDVVLQINPFTPTINIWLHRQDGRLEKIRQTAIANGVHDLARLSGEEAVTLEPQLRCSAALLSPSTGIVDSHM